MLAAYGACSGDPSYDPNADFDDSGDPPSVIAYHFAAEVQQPDVPVGIVTLNRPKAMNALSRAYFLDLGDPRRRLRWLDISNTSPGPPSSLSKPRRRATSR